MIIAIDGNEANVQNLVGVSVYTTKLLEYFHRKSSQDVQFVIYLRTPPVSHLPTETEFFRYEVVKGRFMWSRLFLPLHILLHGKFDVFFSPAHYSPKGLKKPLVVTIHDLAYFYYPNEFLKKDLFKLKEWTAESILKATKIISVSRTTKKDILSYYKVPDSKVSVIYNGFEKLESNGTTSDVLQRFGLEKEQFFLYVGTVQPRKNIQTLITAFKKVYTQYPNYKLVIVGKKGWLYEDIYKLVDESEKEAIIFTDFLEDNDVVELYKNALSFVHPSFYEGFGIPILEAMSYNLPVIASINASLPEVGGNACLYFDPDIEKELIDMMIKIIDQPEIRKELIEKGRKRIVDFSWEKCGEETLKVLTEAAQ